MGLIILAVFVVCAVYVQTRGRVRHAKLSRRITDHANLLAPINCLFYLFSRYGNPRYYDTDLFPELDVIRDQWEMIRDEAVALHAGQEIKASEKLDDLGFNSFFRRGWKRFYLKWYGSSLPSAETLCPKTTALLESVPSVKAAMFAMLPPGGKLVKHRDPYAGSLRYHLGLVTPNSDDCYLDVDGEVYSWRDGKAVIFDETYIHFAENAADTDRIILFLDVKRPMNNPVVDWINRVFSRVVMGASATKNLPGDKVGFLNRIFGGVYQVRIVTKKIKAFNVPLYYTLQYAFYLALIWLIFF